VAQLRSDLQRCEQELTAARATLRQQEEEARQLATLLRAEKEAAVQRATALLVEKDAAVQQANSLPAEKEAAVQRATALLVEKDAAVQQCANALSQATSLRAEKEAAVQQATAEKVAALQQRDSALQEAASLRDELERVRTAPNAVVQPDQQQQQQIAALSRELAAERKHSAISSACLAVRELSQFETMQLLGAGSFAMVIKCRPRDPILVRLAPEVAVKFMVNYGYSTATAVKDYHKEYSILAGLFHRNVLRMYAVLGPVVPTAEMLALADVSVRDLMVNHGTRQPRKTVAVVMELHSGTLMQYYKEHGPTLTAAAKLRMCRELLGALLYVWENRLVHLDVKFDNVLVAADGHLVLSDFGTAQPVDAQGWLDVSAPLTGNQEHMAPEVLEMLSALRGSARVQLSGQPCWECGTMFYQMITGEFPYETYPVLGRSQARYPAVDAAALGGVHPVLAEVTLALIRWLPNERMSLADASARLEALMQ
jgi:hypothetical protein